MSKERPVTVDLPSTSNTKEILSAWVTAGDGIKFAIDQRRKGLARILKGFGKGDAVHTRDPKTNEGMAIRKSRVNTTGYRGAFIDLGKMLGASPTDLKIAQKPHKRSHNRYTARKLGRPRALTARQERRIGTLYMTGSITQAELASIYGVSTFTIAQAIKRQKTA